MVDRDERDRELEELREENARLKAGSEDARGNDRSRRSTRWTVAIVLLVLGGLLLAAAVPATWAGRTLLNTDRYTETVAPLANNPAIRNSVAITAVDRIFARVDVESQLRSALPPRADFAAPSITSGLHDFSVKAAEKALATQQFQTLWTEANREAHQRIVPALLSGTAGRTGAVSIEQGTVTIDMTKIVAQVKQTLASKGITFVQNIPDTVAGGSVPLFQSAQLAQAQSFLRALRTLAILLPILALLALGSAVAIAPDRRRALLWVGVTTIIAMLALGVGLALVRDAYVSSPPAGILSGAGAVAFFDTLVRFLRNAVRTIAVLGLVLLVGSALAGPSSGAVRVRRSVSSGSAALGLNLGRFSEWTERHRGAVDALIVVIAAVVLFATNTPTPGLVIGLAVSVLVGFVLVELVARSHPTPGGPYRGEPSM